MPCPTPTAALVVFWWRDRPVAHRWSADAPLQGSGRLAPTELAPVQAEERAAPVARLDASVVICTRDRPDELRRCLASLPRQSWPAREVIVVDNASRDGRTREVAAAAGVSYVREDRPGLDIARNAGCAPRQVHPRGLHRRRRAAAPDCWLERLVAAFDAPQVAAVTGLVLPGELDSDAQCHFETALELRTRLPAARLRRAAFAAGQRQAACSRAWELGAGASMAFRREVFDRVGGFDERLDVGQAGCSGDSEYWYRLLASGLTCRYEPRSVALHFHRRTIDGLAHQIHHYMRGHAAALLVQHERTGLAVNRHQAWVTMPSWYAGRLWSRLRGGPRPADRFLRQEILGYLSGLWFYLRHPREGDVGR